MTPGTRIGRYELVALLGHGGMGEVWAATLLGPRGFRKPVAVKLLRAGMVRDGDVEALVSEARLGAALSHPGIVSTHDLCEVGGQWLIAMERVHGPSLGELVRGGPLPGRAVVEVGAQVCAALAHVHGSGLVHRDLKPSNLLVDRSGLVKIADLGIARLAGTPDGVAGTPGYAPPEQLEGRAEARSDLFALGVTLGRLATGQRPFGHGVPAMAAVGRAEAHLASTGWLTAVEAAVPGLGSVLEGCLRSDPSRRWDDADTLGRELQALLPTLRGTGLHTVLQRALPDAQRGGPLGTTTPSPAPTRTAPTLVARVGNLPSLRDRFVGREQERAALLAAVRGDERLVTLLGPGGAGKTRLSLEVGRLLDTELPGGAWFCDLSEAVTADGVLNLVGRALGVPLRGDAVDQLGHALAGRDRTLVVLDNLEQVVDPAKPLVERWLALAPDVTFLVTSRTALRLRGEHTLAVGPLQPDDGVALFEARSLRPVDGEQARIRTLVEAVDGLPLAIELAAARTRILSVEQILARLQDRFRLLAGGGSDRPARHRSLRASLDASWELLADHEQAALAQLSVFAGGFDLEAVEAVLDLSGFPDAPWPLDVLDTLVDQSLVTPSSGRFRLLVTVQAYASDQLSRAERALAEVRHGQHFARIGSGPARDALNGPEGTARFAALADELENLVVAARRAAARGDPDVAETAALAASEILDRQGPLPLANELLTAVLSTRGGAQRTHVQRKRGYLRQAAGDLDGALADYTQALRRALVDGHRLFEGILRLDVAAIAQIHGEPGAEEGIRGALEIFRELGARRFEAGTRSVLGHQLLTRGHLDEARAHFEAALQGYREVGDRRFEADAICSLGTSAWADGRLDVAAQRYAEALHLFRDVASRRSEGLVLGNLGVVLAARGDMAEARRHYEAALAIHREVGDRRRAADVLVNLGNLHLEQGRIALASSCYEEARPAVEQIGGPIAKGLLAGSLGNLHLASGHAAEARAHYETASREHGDIGDRLGVASWEAGLAQLDLDAGDLAAALQRAHEALQAARGYPDAEASVSTVLVTALVRAGEVAGARDVLDAVRGRSQDLGTRVRLDCAEAVVCDAEGSPRAAEEALDQAVAGARLLGAGPGSPLARVIELSRGSIRRRTPR